MLAPVEPRCFAESTVVVTCAGPTAYFANSPARQSSSQKSTFAAFRQNYQGICSRLTHEKPCTSAREVLMENGEQRLACVAAGNSVKRERSAPYVGQEKGKGG